VHGLKFSSKFGGKEKTFGKKSEKVLKQLPSPQALDKFPIFAKKPFNVWIFLNTFGLI